MVFKKGCCYEVQRGKPRAGMRGSLFYTSYCERAWGELQVFLHFPAVPVEYPVSHRRCVQRAAGSFFIFDITKWIILSFFAFFISSFKTGTEACKCGADREEGEGVRTNAVYRVRISQRGGNYLHERHY